VLLSIADYRRLLADERSIVDWLSVDDGVDLEAGRLDSSSSSRSCDLPARHERRQRVAQPLGRADPGLHAWARAQRTSDLWLSVITV
jgi:hypothetical protein